MPPERSCPEGSKSHPSPAYGDTLFLSSSLLLGVGGWTSPDVCDALFATSRRRTEAR
jgi:hypothetical protein